MLRYECDNCQKLKGKGEEEWILGFAAENIGVKGTQRKITFLSKWDEEQAVDWLAVHFCSQGCKQDYTSRLFLEMPAAVASKTRVLPFQDRGKRVVPAGRPSAPPRKSLSRRSKGKDKGTLRLPKRA